MTRILDPLSGDVIDVDSSVAPLLEELWARLGGQPGTSTPGSDRAPEPAPDPPARRKRSPARLIVPWMAGQLAKVHDGLPGRYQLMTDLGEATGMRQGELFGCNLGDFSDSLKDYRIRVQIKRIPGGLVFAPPKHERERSVPVPPDVRRNIATHTTSHGTAPVTLPWRTLDGEPRTLLLLHTSQHATALDRAYVNRLWETAVRSAGIEWRPQDSGMHMLRHIAASRWLAAGADLTMISHLLGHADLATTERYIHRLGNHDTRTRQVVAKAARRPQPRPAKLPAGVADFGAWQNRRSS
jgi:integrase